MAGVNRMSMMEQVHLAGEDEDDIYGGFNDYNATLDTDVCIFLHISELKCLSTLTYSKHLFFLYILE